jgi:asparagine synthase (glutamine-hydrolysing)
MGSIAGWVANRAQDESALGPMLERLAHRAAAEPLSGYVDRRKSCQVVLGASLYDKQSGIALVLDGAIANREELKSWLAKRGLEAKNDSELLLRAYQYWDKDAIKHLRGGFAFAIWDGRKERLLLARDRFGEKPLYLREANGTLAFASEPKALATADAEIDLDAVWEHLACRYVPGPRTLLKGIRKLPPGSYAVWQFRKLTETRYWQPPDRSPHFQEDVREDPVGGFIERLSDAVRLSLPGGVFLSGGIDSAAIVALATQQGAKISTFSAGFAEDKASELPAAARAAKHFGTEHYELILSKSEIIDRLPKLVAMRDAPLSRPSDIALHLLAAHAARVTPVVLTGEGGDEVLGGYRRHAAEPYAWAFRGLPTVLALIAPLAGPASRMHAAAASLPIEDWRERALRWNGGLTRAERARISILDIKDSRVENHSADPMASPLRRVLFFEQTSSLPDNLLERADRMAMAASVEARAPFLDHRLVEYVSALPDELRVRGLSTKWILRRALSRLAPPRALSLKKGGWLPAGSLRGELGALARDHLTGAASRTRAYYEPKVLDRVLDEHDKGRGKHEELLWTLLNLEIWHRTQSPAHA